MFCNINNFKKIIFSYFVYLFLFFNTTSLIDYFSHFFEGPDFYLFVKVEKQYTICPLNELFKDHQYTIVCNSRTNKMRHTQKNRKCIAITKINSWI